MVRYRWRTELKACASRAEVLKVVENFVGEWSPAELRELPIEVGAFKSARDICDFGCRLGHVHATFDGPTATLVLLQELLLFFTQAAVRVTQMPSVERSPITARR